MGTGVFRVAMCVGCADAGPCGRRDERGRRRRGLSGVPGIWLPVPGRARVPDRGRGLRRRLPSSPWARRTIDVRTGTPQISLPIGGRHQRRPARTPEPPEPERRSTASTSAHPSGLIASVSDSTGARWLISYDSAGRVVKIVGPTGTFSVSYDAARETSPTSPSTPADASRHSATTDAAGSSAWGDSGGDSATVTYNAAGHLNSLAMVITADRPDAEPSPTTGAGNVLTWTNADGIAETLTYTHDSLGHVTTAKAAPSSTRRFSYTPPHALSSVVGRPERDDRDLQLRRRRTADRRVRGALPARPRRSPTTARAVCPRHARLDDEQLHL